MSVHAAVVINEVFPKPSDETSEWIELYNNGSDSVSLSGYKLENTAGDKKSYTIGPNTDIAGGGFFLLPRSQTTISLVNEGDIVRLFDPGNNQIDTQEYPSTLGYNTSMGRSIDGGGSWAICTTPTPNKPNNCPPPPPTSTPQPTNSPTPSIAPVPTDTPAPTAPPTSSQSTPVVLGTMNLPIPTLATSKLVPTPTPENFMQSEEYKLAWIAGLSAGATLAIIALFTGIYRTFKLHWK